MDKFMNFFMYKGNLSKKYIEQLRTIEVTLTLLEYKFEYLDLSASTTIFFHGENSFYILQQLSSKRMRWVISSKNHVFLCNQSTRKMIKYIQNIILNKNVI